VAIKRVGHLFYDLVDAKRVLREVLVLGLLRRARAAGGCGNHVELLDLMVNPPRARDFHALYIVTRMYECDLDRIVSSPQRLTEAHIQYFVFQLLRGVRDLHAAGVVHRDLKPGNLLVNSNCDLVICDFGLAREAAAGAAPMTEYVVTRWYRAPELLADCPDYGAPVDVWAAGCIFAELLGRRTFLRGASSTEQLALIVGKLRVPPGEADDMFMPAQPLALVRRTAAAVAAGPPPPPLEELLPDASPGALEVLRGLLAFNPARRATADAALRHPYFERLRKIYPDVAAEGAAPPARAPGGAAAAAAAAAAAHGAASLAMPEDMSVADIQRAIFREKALLKSAIASEAAAAGAAVSDGGAWA